ncbi:hypothetical protein C1H46_011851 [Malus baccata]|uniref:Uncharacterized protein n=1 Tax=Malus baccata TaxID=106549 RepID=A0A540MUR4_MALBA|nr:hypothetical protein C1H46_011851 [Malus baccata]
MVGGAGCRGDEGGCVVQVVKEGREGGWVGVVEERREGGGCRGKKEGTRLGKVEDGCLISNEVKVFEVGEPGEGGGKGAGDEVQGKHKRRKPTQVFSCWPVCGSCCCLPVNHIAWTGGH